MKRLKGYEEYIETVVGGKIVRYFRGWEGLATATITIHNNGWATLRIYCARQEGLEQMEEVLHEALNG